MKPELVLLSVLFVFFLSSCDQSLSPNSRDQLKETVTYNQMSMVRANVSDVPAQVQQKYRLDAETITALRINKKDSTQIELPTPLIDVIYNGLIHIYNSSGEQANEVTHTYKIHRMVKAGASRNLYIVADTTQKYAQAWVDGILKTGNAAIDHLMEKYHIELGSNAHKIKDIIAAFRSKKPYNQFALAKLFDERKDVKYAGANINFVDGDNIKVDLKKDHINYEFSKGFGDCLSGCIGRHYWTFNVFGDGKVKFVNENGASLPK